MDITIIIAAIFGIIIGIIIGAFFGILAPLINKFFVKKNSVKKIMDQNVTFRIEGEVYDLKGEIKKELSKNNVSLVCMEGEKKEVLSSRIAAPILPPKDSGGNFKEAAKNINKNPGVNKKVFRI